MHDRCPKNFVKVDCYLVPVENLPIQPRTAALLCDSGERGKQQFPDAGASVLLWNKEVFKVNPLFASPS